MASTKLILVEGIPGSGKTTTAGFVARWLAARGIPTALFLEGNSDHPADFESIARLDEREFAALLARFPVQASLLKRAARVDGGDHFFRYRDLQDAHPHLPDMLFTALASYEIYELPAATFQRLLRRRWQQFAATAASGDTTYIFECAFLQNPLTMMLGRHDETPAAAGTLVLDLASIVQPLAPRWLYLDPGDVRATLASVAQTRPPEWLEFVIAYHTRQGHGRAQGWRGFDGLVCFYEMRRAVELALLPRLPFPGLLLHHMAWADRTWAENEERIASFLTPAFRA